MYRLTPFAVFWSVLLAFGSMTVGSVSAALISKGLACSVGTLPTSCSSKDRVFWVLYTLTPKGNLCGYRIGTGNKALAFVPVNRRMGTGEIISEFAVLPGRKIAYLVYDTPKGVFLEANRVNSDGEFLAEKTFHRIKIPTLDRIANLIISPKNRVLYLVSSYGEVWTIRTRRDGFFYRSDKSRLKSFVPRFLGDNNEFYARTGSVEKDWAAIDSRGKYLYLFKRVGFLDHGENLLGRLALNPAGNPVRFIQMRQPGDSKGHKTVGPIKFSDAGNFAYMSSYEEDGIAAYRICTNGDLAPFSSEQQTADAKRQIASAGPQTAARIYGLLLGKGNVAYGFTATSIRTLRYSGRGKFSPIGEFSSQGAVQIAVNSSGNMLLVYHHFFLPRSPLPHQVPTEKAFFSVHRIDSANRPSPLPLTTIPLKSPRNGFTIVSVQQ